MEITSVHKYIALNKMANGTTEVLFSGQPCLYAAKSLYHTVVGESSNAFSWRINPVFAKLVYGANVLEDIPHCDESFETEEEAIAGGLVKLHELGAFNTEVDLPEDSYAATMQDIHEEVKSFALKQSKNIMEIQRTYASKMKYIFEGIPKKEDVDYEKWMSDVKTAHPDKKLKFISRNDDKQSTISAEESGVDRSHGIWDNKTNKGQIFKITGEATVADDKKETPAEEKKEEKEIVKALKKDKKFVSKYGEDSVYAVASKSKE